MLVPLAGRPCILSPVPADIASQLRAVQQEMSSRPQGLQDHSRRVASEAIDLAGYYDVDPERCELAAWIHDLFRHIPEDQQVLNAFELGIEVTDEDRIGPIVLHGPAAARFASDRLGVDDEEVLEAVSSHTLGLPDMTYLAKIILLADKFESKKREKRPYLKAIRQVARRDLDVALLCWSDWSWVEAQANGWHTHADHWTARAAWVAEHHVERASVGRVADDVFELSLK